MLELAECGFIRVNTGLKDKLILVTGAQHGIGAATAKAFAAQGACVFIHYFRPPASSPSSRNVGMNNTGSPGEALYRARQAATADEVVAGIRAEGGRAEAWEADLSRPETISTLFDRAEAAFGPVQVLVNNAAY
jgi:3-oxoacyl-[acyl-carrier protein] reductase